MARKEIENVVFELLAEIFRLSQTDGETTAHFLPLKLNFHDEFVRPLLEHLEFRVNFSFMKIKLPFVY